jgi:ABC-type sulfate transport system permease subunit
MNLRATQESPAVRVGLIALTVVLLVTLLLLPLAVVALKHGLAIAADALVAPDAIAAI